MRLYRYGRLRLEGKSVEEKLFKEKGGGIGFHFNMLLWHVDQVELGLYDDLLKV